MVDAATMTKLESLTGAEFDKLWLESMISHHQGAIEMAKAEIANGDNVDAKSLANNIVDHAGGRDRPDEADAGKAEMAAGGGHGIAAEKELRQAARRIEGQVRGIAKMIDEDKYCIDVLTQISAVNSALQSVALGLLDEHLGHCVTQAVADGGDEAEPSWPRRRRPSPGSCARRYSSIAPGACSFARASRTHGVCSTSPPRSVARYSGNLHVPSS